MVTIKRASVLRHLGCLVTMTSRPQARNLSAPFKEIKKLKHLEELQQAALVQLMKASKSSQNVSVISHMQKLIALDHTV